MSIKNTGYGLHNGGAGWARSVFRGGEVPKKLPASGFRRGSTTRVMYVPDHASFGAFIKSEQMRKPTAEAARDIALAAAGFTPPSTGSADSRGLHDEVKGGFKVKRNAGLLKVSGNLRVKVEVVNDVEGSALVEFGAKNIQRIRMLGRAGAMFGDFKPEGGPGGDA